ncbi:MAG: hypothetical protein A2289_24635 [Deltaproteobacteria bacterium RIFOXYA12_FULL_58_15]|nr:MAG: hypothetical protein A2289_24635 [Deltaproteobacteria bacterium RIFOXYA12_FULL_58_15]OGR12704.1 MAG: hypothetical protein A2341_07785 [Deltaproteobacteria bacterium RIFOXYB12_FULL_58_9]
MVGKRAGQRIIRLRPQWSDHAADDGRQSQNNGFEPQGQTPDYGFSVHAKRRVSAHDRKGLARLVRYITRPMVSNKHLKLLGNGNVLLELKRPFSKLLGTTRRSPQRLNVIDHWVWPGPPVQWQLGRPHRRCVWLKEPPTRFSGKLN